MPVSAYLVAAAAAASGASIEFVAGDGTGFSLSPPEISSVEVGFGDGTKLPPPSPPPPDGFRVASVGLELN